MRFSWLKWILQCLLMTAVLVPSSHGEQINIETLNGRKISLYKACHALVVGVAHYAYWPSRPDAVEEARDVSWELRRQGFEVDLLTDPTGEELHGALNQLAEEKGSNAEMGVVIYFAGHGQRFASEGDRSQSWLLPRDAPRPESNRKAFKEKSVSSVDLIDLAGRIRAKHLLLILNAPFTADAFQEAPYALKVVNDATAQSACQFISAGRGNGAKTEAGVFNRFLLSGLQGEADLVYDGVITASELALYLSDRVGNVTGQQLKPQYGRFAFDGDNHGDFVFLRSERHHTRGRLFVDVRPVSATVRIMNYQPLFFQGMELNPGTYKLEVSAQGYETIARSIDLAAGEDRTVAVELIKIQDEIKNRLGMTFIRIKSGSFTMGSPAAEPGHKTDESQHRVKLSQPFLLQQTEVTVAQFERFVRVSGYRTEAEKGGGCWIRSAGRGWARKKEAHWKHPGAMSADSNQPVVCVTWNDATAFARWLSDQEGRRYRLPSEAEWEYAARAGTVTPFAYGRCLSSDEANYAGVGKFYQLCAPVFGKMRGRTLVTGTLKPNPWRLYDMLGNAAEWCADWYGPYASGGVTVDPLGPEIATDRVIRGGHWQADAAGCRSAWRGRFPPGFASDVVGFRLVMGP